MVKDMHTGLKKVKSFKVGKKIVVGKDMKESESEIVQDQEVF